jgi:tyrosinase
VPTVQRTAIGSGKIFAKLSDVTAPEADNALICKVFVNCPYLSPETPSTDPLCAGSFSFFGSHGSSHGHDDIYVDITKPLHALSNNGTINPEALSIQIMAVPYGGGATDTSFQIGKVELISL